MNLEEALKEESNKTYTENGALALKSTFNANLDYFGELSMYKLDGELGLNYFKKAYQEDAMLAMKSLFYTRNFRGLGQGLRNVTRLIYNYLANRHTETMRANLALVSEFGRFDDYYAFVDTPLEKDAMEILCNQIRADLSSNHPSLCAKWLASCNTSNAKTRKLGRLTAKYLNMNLKEYRQTLSLLRKKLDVVEVKMCNKEFDKINYEAVPSKAMLNYRNAFLKNDNLNYSKYLESVSKGDKKINSGTLYPYDILAKASLSTMERYLSCQSYDKTLEEAWKALPNYVDGNLNSIVVADTSGSMTGNPLNVAISLGIYFAERNKGIWKDKLITFSSKPTFVDFSKAKSLDEKIECIPSIIENTNINAVFDLILKTAVKNHIKQEDMLESIIIVSDMQFDYAEDANNKYYGQIIKEKFEKKGYKAPALVFWNVNEYFNIVNHAKYDEQGIKMVSGFSPSVFEEVVKNIESNPLEAMLNILNNEIFDKIKVVD